jgi:hypothetical protein
MDPAKPETLSSTPQADHVTQAAAHLSVVEVALGTFIHAIFLPFGGHLLSLNEALFLARAAEKSETRTKAALASYEIAGVAAAMKSLAPTARKLGPMLGIMTQGLLFSLGLLLGGHRRIGQILGLMLLSTWAFIQHFITLFISFGPDELAKVLQFYQERLTKEFSIVGTTLITAVLGLYAIKCLVGTGLIFWMNKKSDQKWLDWVMGWQVRAQKYKRPANRGPRSAWAGALRDLANPIFLISFALTFAVFCVQKESVSQIVWLSLRPIAIGFILFYLLRATWFMSWLDQMTKNSAILRPIRRRLELVQQSNQPH